MTIRIKKEMNGIWYKDSRYIDELIHAIETNVEGTQIAHKEKTHANTYVGCFHDPIQFPSSMIRIQELFNSGVPGLLLFPTHKRRAVATTPRTPRVMAFFPILLLLFLYLHKPLWTMFSVGMCLHRTYAEWILFPAYFLDFRSTGLRCFSFWTHSELISSISLILFYNEDYKRS